MTQNDETLENFKEYLAVDVRDKVIVDMLEILLGKIKAPYLVELHNKVRNSEFNVNQIAVIKELAIYLIDSVMDYFLWRVEQEEELKIFLNGIDLEEVSDGLCGDYVGSVREYSHFPAIDEFNANLVNLDDN